MRTIKTLAMLVLLLALGSGAALAQKKNDPPKQVPLNQFIDKHFAHWDRNHDDVLDIAEVDRSVEDHNVFGREAAVIFRIRERMTGKGKPSHLSHQQVLALAQDRAFEKAVDATAKQLADQFFDRFSARVAPAAALAPAEMLEAPPLPVSAAPSATQVSAMPAAPPTAGMPAAAAITPAGATTPAAATAAAAFAAARPATTSAPPPSQAAPIFPAAPSQGHQPTHPPTTTRSFPSAPGSVVSDQVLPPPYPSASISIFSLIPREPFGLPIAAWIGGLVYLFILLLFIGSIL